MNKKPSRRREIIQRTVIYTTMTLIVTSATLILVLLTLGYRFNREEGVIEQGGLVHFITRPVGAQVTVGQAELANKTRSRITLNPGTYPVTMERDGYVPWQKTIQIAAGEVLWLNSALLIPTQPVTTAALDVPRLSSAAFYADGRYAAFISRANQPSIQIATLNKEVAETETITFPAASFSDAASHRFKVLKWDGDSRNVLIQHTFGKANEFLVVNATDPDDIRTLKAVDSAQPRTVLFDPRSNDSAIVLYSDGTVRTVRLSDGETTLLPLESIASVSLGSRNSLLYVTKPEQDTVTTGYLTLGSSVPRELSAYPAKDKPLIALDDYFGATYLVQSRGKAVTLSKFRTWPNSESTAPTESELVTTIETTAASRFIGLEGKGRFVRAQYGSTQAVYDIQKKLLFTVPIVDAKTLTSPVRWLDEFHFWDGSTGMLRHYEFDGTNQTDIAPVATQFPVVYGPEYEYVYSFAPKDKGFVLQATRLRVE